MLNGIIRFLGVIVCCAAVTIPVALSDSLELRDGRHLQGKYAGGTTAVIGFLSGAGIEYFPTSDVLALIFDRSTVDAPLGTQIPQTSKPLHPMSARGGKTHASQQGPTASRNRASPQGANPVSLTRTGFRSPP